MRITGSVPTDASRRSIIWSSPIYQVPYHHTYTTQDTTQVAKERQSGNSRIPRQWEVLLISCRLVLPTRDWTPPAVIVIEIGSLQHRADRMRVQYLCPYLNDAASHHVEAARWRISFAPRQLTGYKMTINTCFAPSSSLPTS